MGDDPSLYMRWESEDKCKMEWSEKLYEELYSERYADRIRRMLLVLFLFIIAVAWSMDMEHSGRYSLSEGKTGTEASAFGVASSENSETYLRSEEHAVSVPADAEISAGTPGNSEMSENSGGSIAYTVPTDIAPIVPDIATVPDTPADITMPVPDIPSDIVPTVPDIPSDIVPTVPDIPSDTVPTVPDAPSDAAPIMPDAPAETVPSVPDGILTDDTDETVPDEPSVIVPDEPDSSADGSETVPPVEVPGTVDGFYVNDAGMITGIADPSVVMDGYLALPAEGCSGIASGAFLNAPAGIREIYIPSNISYIEEGAFTGLSEIEWFEMAASGGNYTADGVLFSEGGTCILAFPPARTGSYKVPSQVVRFASGAFDASQIEVLDAAECLIADIGNLPSGIRVITGNLSM